MRRSVEFTASRIVAIVIVVVALVVVAAIAIYRTVRAAETAAAVATMTQDVGQVTAGELAQWILEKRSDYQLIDLRDEWHFDDYHIPTAINVPRATLFQPERLKQLDRQKKIVVYSLGAGDGAKAQLLLSMKGYRAYALEDGIIGWWDAIMTPSSIRSAKPSSSGYQQARQLREFFMTGSAAPAAATSGMPAPVAAPVPRQPQAASPARPAAQPISKTPPPAKKATPAEPAKKPPPPTPSEQEKQKLKLGTGCS